MASPAIITEPLRLGRRVAALALFLVGTSVAQAAPPGGNVTRSILRLQGYRVVAATGTTPAAEMVLTARGVEHRFRLTDRRRFALGQPDAEPPRERDRLTLQGDFDVLARFAKARPDQQVTILGEQRPGSGDLFILTIDLCPP